MTRDALTDFRSSEGVFGDFLVNFSLVGILENIGFLMPKIEFGLTCNLSVVTWDLPDSYFHVLVPDWCQNEPKVDLISVFPVVLRANHDYHRISHGLKPVVPFHFCFWSLI